MTEYFGKSLQIGRILSYAKATCFSVMKVWLVYLPITFLLTLAGMIALYVGIFPAMVISNAAWIYMMWAIYEIYRAQGGESVPLNPNPPPVPSEAS
ncbi:MAG: hypothetical protein ACREP8_04285 [Candidatus Binatia bacterium]